MIPKAFQSDKSKLENFYNSESKNVWIPKHFDISKNRPIQFLIKRVFDFSATFFGLILISPLMIVVAILIKLESPGPVFFKQKRIGIYGKIFDMYKFRSMHVGAESKEHLIREQFSSKESIMFKLENDPRVTRIGKFIRKYSIDELPQLFNVLKGDMSLVGPRPRVPRDLESFDRWHYVFFATLPGITGMWQTSGRSKIKNFDKVMELEYSYITNWNILLDFYLLLKTIPVVITGRDTS